MKFKLTIKIILLFLVTTILNAQGQDEKLKNPEHICGTDKVMKELYKAHPQSKAEAEEFSKFTQNFDAKSVKATTYVIPVVFHVFGTSFNGMSVNDALIKDALARTNSDFQGLTADWNQIISQFNNVKKALNVTFALAKIDPNGNPTTGITYHSTMSGFGNGSGYDSQIQQYAWDNYKYFNVYIQNDLYNDGTTNNSGVCWYPDSWMSDNNLARCVYNGAYIGNNTDENFRSVLTHEFGHYLNLIHTFEGGCPDASSCSNSGDHCCDTPPADYSHLDGATNCQGQITNWQNFMDYTTNYAMFTINQVARMEAALQHPARYTLWQQSNLVATGVATGGSDTQAPSTPTNLHSTSVTSNSVSLAWNASTDNIGVTGYSVYRNSTNIGTATGTSYTATGLNASTTYSFYVRANDAAGNTSGNSTAINVTTSGSGPDDGGALTSGVAGNGNMDSADGSDMWYIDVPANATSMHIVLECGSSDFDTYGRFNAQPTISTYDWRGYSSGGEDNTVTNPSQGRHYIMVDYYSGSGAYTLTATVTTGGGTDTQAPSTPTNLHSTSVTSSSVSLAWNASTDNVGVTAYSVYRNSTNIGTATGTSYTATGLTASTSYSFYVRAMDAAGNTSGNSAAINVSTSGGGADDGGALTSGIAGNGNMDSADGSDMWYIDVPANATSLRVVLECGSSDYDSYGRFNAQPTTTTYDWRGYTSGGEDNTVSNPSQGRHYIMVDYYSGSGAYTLTATVTGGGGTDTQAPSTPSNLHSTSVTSSSVSLAWNASTDNVGVTAYYVYRNSTNIGTATGTSYTATGLSANTSYTFFVRAADAAGNTSGNSNTINASTSGGTNPTYCASNGNSTTYEYIDLVSLGNINRTSGSDGGYVLASNTTSLVAGTSYTMSYSSYISSTYTEVWRVWIDFNRDGDFDDAGETVVSNSSSSTGTLSSTVSIPSNASAGITRMRVSMRYNTAPTSCGSFDYGEVEDYNVSIGAQGPVAESTQNLNLKVYPNPSVDGYINVEVNGAEGKSAVVNINSLTGSTIFSKTVNLNDNIRLDVSGLASGVYVLNVITSNGIISNQIIIK